MPSHENDTLEALDKIAIAFEEMISDYEERKRDRPYISPFYFGGDRLLDSSFTMQLGGIGLGDALIPRLGDFGDQVKESIESMQGAIKILALGIDYRRYLKFKGLTPRLTRYGARDWNIERRFDEEDKPSSEDARFCMDFVVESALALSEFDYSQPRRLKGLSTTVSYTEKSLAPLYTRGNRQRLDVVLRGKSSRNVGARAVLSGVGCHSRCFPPV